MAAAGVAQPAAWFIGGADGAGHSRQRHDCRFSPPVFAESAVHGAYRRPEKLPSDRKSRRAVYRVVTPAGAVVIIFAELRRGPGGQRAVPSTTP